MPKTTRGSMALLITLGMFVLLGGTMYTAYDDQAEANEPLIIKTNNSLALNELPTEGLKFETIAEINNGEDSTTEGASVSPTPSVVHSQNITEETGGMEAEITAYIKEVFGKDADEAIQIAKCESGLRPNAINDNTTWGGRGVDKGLFQINNSWQEIDNDSFLFDYKINTILAKKIFDNRGNWSAWSCARKLGL